jgi:glutathione synthase/RimK-type ligase-like ATP-grasp enzyme
MNTIQDMKAPHVIRVLAEDIEESVQKSLAHIQSNRFELSIYFGKNISKRYDRLSLQIYNLFQAPLLRVFFYRKGNKWKIQNIQVISAKDIPDEHHEYVIEFATRYFSRRISGKKRRHPAPYDMAILINENEKTPPSDKKAIEYFIKAGEKSGFNVELVGKEDIHRIAEFDALFIRETTGVNHHTFRFSQRAEAEGLAVIDDPESIIKCTNKVYLAELLKHHHIPAPETVVFNKHNAEAVLRSMSFPLILKQPDSSYSQGVVKVDSGDDFLKVSTKLLEKSSLVIAQTFMKTEYDWRVGIINGSPIYACRYYMVKDHWQIVSWNREGDYSEGAGDTIAVEDAPPKVIETALKASRFIGQGLYGVDLKVVNGKCYVIEINDNPSIDHDVEDRIIKDKLYSDIMEVFAERVRKNKKE